MFASTDIRSTNFSEFLLNISLFNLFVGLLLLEQPIRQLNNPDMQSHQHQLQHIVPSERAMTRLRTKLPPRGHTLVRIIHILGCHQLINELGFATSAKLLHTNISLLPSFFCALLLI